MNNLEPESYDVSQVNKWQKFLSVLPDIRNLLFVIISIVAFIGIMWTVQRGSELTCLMPQSSVELLLPVLGLVGITAIGTPFTPAVLAVMLFWAIIKSAFFCH